MAKIEDYLPGGQNDPAGGVLEEEISDAQGQQQARQEDATPDVDWENRYKELEKLNSRQAQTLGEYRKTIDDFIVNPTPAVNAETDQGTGPETFSLDEFYDHPDQAISKIVESHPAIQEARQLKQDAIDRKRQDEHAAFAARHTDFIEIGGSPEFQNWVMDNPTRMDLFQRADGYDFSAADALFSLYKAEKGLSQVNNQRDIAQAELVSSSGELAPAEPPRYSRSEYIAKKTRAIQGDLEAEQWVKANSAGYREALGSGNVRD